MNSYNWTGERLVTAIEDETATEHLHRYGLVLQYCKGKTVVDIACGEGYGSSFLAEVASDVTGIDIDQDVVDFASKKYCKSNLRYLQGSASSIPYADASADVVVSFETIEHHDQHEEMMREIKRILKPDGLLIISTPDKKYYSDERNFRNSFHVKELTRQEFGELMARYFKNTRMLLQRVTYGSLIVPEDSTAVKFELLTGNYHELSPLNLKPFYLIAFNSDSQLPEPVAGFFDGTANLQAKVSAVYSSASYQLGYKILQPFRALKSLFKSKS